MLELVASTSYLRGSPARLWETATRQARYLNSHVLACTSVGLRTVSTTSSTSSTLWTWWVRRVWRTWRGVLLWIILPVTCCQWKGSNRTTCWDPGFWRRSLTWLKLPCFMICLLEKERMWYTLSDVKGCYNYLTTMFCDMMWEIWEMWCDLRDVMWEMWCEKCDIIRVM